MTMFNKDFQLDVLGTSPFAYEVKEEPFTGITITGRVTTTDVAFLDDLELGEKREGLRYILSGTIPTDDDVALKFTCPAGLLLKFGEYPRHMGCTVEEVRVGAIDEGGMLRVKLKIKCPNIKASEAGEIVSGLRQVVTVRLIDGQLKLI